MFRYRTILQAPRPDSTNDVVFMMNGEPFHEELGINGPDNAAPKQVEVTFGAATRSMPTTSSRAIIRSRRSTPLALFQMVRTMWKPMQTPTLCLWRQSSTVLSRPERAG